MGDVYMKQRKTLPEKETPDQGAVNYLNTNRLPQFMELLGLEVKPGDKAPESGGVPRLFILDEENPNQPRTLEEEGAEIGSMKFWEYARKGMLFGYAAGEKEPVQVQLKGDNPGSLSLSEPLSTEPGKLASRNQNTGIEQPEYQDLPKAVRQPGFFSRLLHRINSNWYKAENEAYEANRRERQRITEENRVKREDYEKKVAEAKRPLDAVCQAVSAGLSKAFAAKRTEQQFSAEIADKEAGVKRKKMKAAQASLDSNAATAAQAASAYDRSISMMKSIYGPKPSPLQDMVVGNHYQVDDFKKFTDIDLPEKLSIGEKKVDEKLFANIALHAQLDYSVGKIWDAHEHNGGSMLPGLMDEGLTEKQAQQAISHASGGMLIGDLLRDPPRVDFGQFFDSSQKGREIARDAITDYQAGKKDKLAQIIVNAAKYTTNETKAMDAMDGHATITDTRLTGELLDLLDQDEELLDKAGDMGLTQTDIDVCRGADYFQELKDANLMAEAKLTQAAAEHRELPEAEKQQAVRDIYKFRTANALIRREMSEDQPQYAELNKEIAEITMRESATGKAKRGGKMPEGMKPIGDGLYTPLVSFKRILGKSIPSGFLEMAEYKEEAKEAKAAGRKPAANSLDKLAEMTVKSLKLDTMSTAKLAEKATGISGLKDNALLGLQGKLAADEAKAEKQKQEEAERIKAEHKEVDLDTAVLYDKKGKVIGGGGPEAGM